MSKKNEKLNQIINPFCVYTKKCNYVTQLDKLKGNVLH